MNTEVPEVLGNEWFARDYSLEDGKVRGYVKLFLYGDGAAQLVGSNFRTIFQQKGMLFLGEIVPPVRPLALTELNRLVAAGIDVPEPEAWHREVIYFPAIDWPVMLGLFEILNVFESNEEKAFKAASVREDAKTFLRWAYNLEPFAIT